MEKKKAYIAGKISELPYPEVVEKFAKAEAHVTNLGFEAINPIKLCPEGVDWHVAMRICVRELATADILFTTPDAIFSRGASIEMQIATDLDIPIFTLTNKDLE